MADNPYTLNWALPLQAIDEIVHNRLAQNKLGMEQERLGFERARQPYVLQSLYEANRHAGVQNPLEERGLQSKLDESDLSFPYELQQKKTAAEAAQETLNATRALRADLGGGPATPATGRMPTPAASVTPETNRIPTAQKAASFVDDFVLKAPNDQAGALSWKTFMEHPEIGPRWQQHVQAYGMTGDWKRDAADFVRDMRHEANGSVLKPFSLASAAGAGAVAGGAGTPPPTAPQQQQQAASSVPSQQATSLTQPADVQALAPRVAAVTQTPNGAVAIDANNQPLFNLASEFQKAQRMISSGVPAFVSAGETHMKFVQSMMEKGGQLTRGGGVTHITGSAETQARAAGMKQEAEKVGEATGNAQANLAGALNSAGTMVRNIDAVLADKGLDQVVGVYAGHSLSPTLRQSSANTEARLKQIQGNQFMQAYQALKGGGAISDAEGAKGGASIARLNETRVDSKEYKAALREAKSDIQDLMYLAVAKSKGDGGPEAIRINALREARLAVSKGAPQDKVAERLRASGIDPSRL